MEKIKIGIDVDDCMCNTLEMDYACALYKYKKRNKIDENIDKEYYYVPKSFHMTNEEAEDFFMKEKQFIMKNNSMYPKMFVKDVIKILRELGFEIIIITSRCDKYWNGNSTQYVKNWLDKYEIEYDKIYSNVENKLDICVQNKIELMIEDNADNIKEINKKGIKSILLKTSYNKNYHHKLNYFADNWLEIYDILNDLFHLNGKEIITI